MMLPHQVELLDYDVRPGIANAIGPAGGFLLLHGLGEDKTSLRPLGDRLCPAGSVAVYPSLRGHGTSPKPTWGYSPWDFTADLQRIASALPDRLHLVGFSYGALVAAASAVALGPGRVRSLVLLDQSFEACPWKAFADHDGALFRPELVYLKWGFDHRHLLFMAAAAGIPMLTVLARRSHVVSGSERRRLLAGAGPRQLVRVLDTDHRGLVSDVPRLAALLEDFYRRTDRVEELCDGRAR
jgi:pimeloyl-ACP methyl ester carboxylesterase